MAATTFSDTSRYSRIQEKGSRDQRTDKNQEDSREARPFLNPQAILPRRLTDSYLRQIEVLTHISPFWQENESNDRSN